MRQVKGVRSLMGPKDCNVHLFLVLSRKTWRNVALLILYFHHTVLSIFALFQFFINFRSVPHSSGSRFFCGHQRLSLDVVSLAPSGCLSTRNLRPVLSLLELVCISSTWASVNAELSTTGCFQQLRRVRRCICICSLSFVCECFASATKERVAGLGSAMVILRCAGGRAIRRAPSQPP